jgi:hypothetical protein
MALYLRRLKHRVAPDHPYCLGDLADLKRDVHNRRLKLH